MNRKGLIAAAAAMAVALAACVDKEQKAAQGYVEQARASIENRNYTEAIALLDTLDHIYPAQTEARREGMRLRPLAIEGATLRDLETTDSLLAVMAIENERNKELLRWVENPVEGYYISAKEKKSDFIGTTGLQAKVSPDGLFYIVSSVTRPVKSTGVVLQCGDAEARSHEVKYDSERNYRRNGTEVITFMSAESDTLGHFASNHRGEAMTLTFIGENPYTVNLTADDVERIADVYDCAALLMQAKRMQMKKGRLEKTLEISRSQQARTFPTE